jgi:NitT/TauT family transport system substrate-binding protein
MHSDETHHGRKKISVCFWIVVIATGWIVFISSLHFRMNVDSKERTTLKMGYMPVISNLACPLLDWASREGNGIRFEALKFSSFAELGEALRNGDIQAAFIIAPLSVVLRQQGADVKVVYIGNRHESTLVVRKDLEIKDFSGLAGKRIAVPMRYSGHHLAVRQLAEKFRLSGGQLHILEMNPPDMPSALATGAIEAYFVGEPFAAQTLRSGKSKVLYYVEQLWPGFICNLLLVRQDYIKQHPDRIQKMVQGAARSGFWASHHTKDAARIVSNYWNQSPDFITYALEKPENRIVFDRFVPKEEEMQYLANQMFRYGLLKENQISGLVDDRFSLASNLNDISDVKSILSPK